MGVYHFPPFEFDSSTLRLRKHGVRIKLQKQPAQILAALLEKPQEPLTRKELHARLWPADTFVDFDRSLNVAIKKLRDSLNDSAEEPRFIETVAGLGYRFIDECSAQSKEDKINKVIGPSVVEEPPKAPCTPEHSNRRFGLRLASAGAFVMALVGIVYAFAAFSTSPRIYRSTNFRLVTRSGTEKTPFTTDGERIYFFESRGEETFFTQLSVNGGEPLHTPASANVLPYQADVLTDKLVYLDGIWHDYFEPGIGVQIWIRHLPAGATWQVPNARCQSVSWTRDGNLLCVLQGQFSILDQQGKVIRKLFNVGRPAFRAHLSPDEKRIRFDMARGNDVEKGWEIWESAIDGTNLHRLVPTLDVSCCGSWSNDRTLYLFQVWNGTRWDVWALPENTGWISFKAKPVRLTSGPLDARYPKMGVDGKEVLFMGADFRGELSMVDVKAGRLVPYLTGESIAELDFSPDRRWITYVAYPEGTLWRSKPDFSEPLQLTRAPLLPYSPRFSHDGTKIVFGDIGGSGNAYVVSVEGGGLTSLGSAYRKCISAESALVDFRFLTQCPTPDGEVELQLVDPNIGKSWRIPISKGLANATISKDGESIAAVDVRSGKLRVFQMQTQRWIEIPIPLTENPGILAWSPSGDSVYVRQETVILRCRLKTGTSEVVIHLPRSSSYLWWGNWLGISPDGKVLLTRQTGASDIYAFDLQNN